MAWYVVFRGRKPGIYTDWPTCNAQVSGYSGSNFMKYSNKDEAIAAYNSFSLNDNCNFEHALQQPPHPRAVSWFTWKDVLITVLVVSNAFLVWVVLSQLHK